MRKMPFIAKPRQRTESEFIGDMLSGGRADAALAVKVAANSIWLSLHAWGCPNPDSSSIERRYWQSDEQRQLLMDKVHREAGYRIWRAIELCDGRPEESEAEFYSRFRDLPPLAG